MSAGPVIYFSLVTPRTLADVGGWEHRHRLDGQKFPRNLRVWNLRASYRVRLE